MTAAALLADWSTTPFGLPPFGQFAPEDFREAFRVALAEDRADVEAIAADPAAADFTAVIEGLERSGRKLRQVSACFYNLVSADANDALQAIEREMAPVMARHRSETLLDARLFAKVDDLQARRADLGLSPEQARVLERYHRMFTRAGAGLDEAGRARMAAISERLAVLSTQFSQNVLADEKAFELVLSGEDDLAGLPDFLRAAALAAGAERGRPGQHVITLARSSIEPFLQFSTRRDLREKAFAAWTRRGEMGGQTDNRAVLAEILTLRQERAALLGFANFAAFKLDDSMAKTPEAVRALLMDVWSPAVAQARREAARLQEMIAAEGGNFGLAAHDWRHYAERLREAEYDFSEAELKPYLPLDRIIAAAFDTASRLFGLSFEEVKGLALYHPDVRAFAVSDAAGRHVGLFLGDYFARPSKRSGAWMSAFRGQQKLEGDIRPIIVNVMNFAKAPAGEASLLTFDDARTLFHEFGHALHGLLSDVTYPMIAGTNVARDFVELPSQLYEHWLSEPTLLAQHAVHYRTGEPIPAALLAKLTRAATFNQGFATVEYVASAIADLDLHLGAPGAAFDATAFEADLATRIGMPREITLRHRLPHFAHVFSGDGYSAGYYSYMWSEVMDADAFAAFEETGNVFDPGTAAKLLRFIYAAGGSRDPAELYRAFRGRMPDIGPLLKKRGLAVASAAT